MDYTVNAMSSSKASLEINMAESSSSLSILHLFITQVSSQNRPTFNSRTAQFNNNITETKQIYILELSKR